MLVKKVYIDLETLPPEIDLDKFKEELEAPGNIKKPESRLKWVEENWEEKYRKLATNTDQANICSIGAAVEEGDINVFLDKNRDEKSILLDFYNFLIEELQADIEEDLDIEVCQSLIIWIGFNNKKFDMDLLWKRAMKHGLYDLCKLIPRERYTKNIFDLMEIWSPFEYNKMIKQDNLCDFFGIEGKPEGIDGSMIYDVWHAGEFDRIIEYNADDVDKVRKLYKIVSKGYNNF